MEEQLYMASDGGELSFLETNGNILIEQGSQNVISIPQGQSNVIYMPAHMCYAQPSTQTTVIPANQTVSAQTQTGQQIIILQTNQSPANVLMESHQPTNLVLSNNLGAQQAQPFTISTQNQYRVSSQSHPQVVQPTLTQQTVNFSPKPIVDGLRSKFISCQFCGILSEEGSHCLSCKMPFNKNSQFVTISPTQTFSTVAQSQPVSSCQTVSVTNRKPSTVKREPVVRKFSVQCPACKRISADSSKCNTCGNLINLPALPKSSVTTTATPKTTVNVNRAVQSQVESASEFMVYCMLCKIASPQGGPCLKCKRPLDSSRYLIKQKGISTLISSRPAKNSPFITKVATVVNPTTSCRQCGSIISATAPCPKCYSNLQISNTPSSSNGSTITVSANHEANRSLNTYQVEKIVMPKDTYKQKDTIVLCKNCGICSENFIVCTNCKHRIQKDSKVMTFAPPVQKNNVSISISTSLQDVDKKPKPRAKPKAKAKIPDEPVVLTLSSDDEDETQSSSSAKDLTDPMPPQSVYTLLHPKEPIITTDDSLLNTAGAEKEISPSIFGTTNEVICRLLCRNVRIGSYHAPLKDKVLFRPLGIQMTVAPSIGDGPNVNVIIPNADVLKILANFSPHFPCLFVYLKPSLARRIRKQLQMDDPKQFYFDPLSPEQRHRRVVILPDTMSEGSKNFIRTLYANFKHKIPVPLFDEVSDRDANHIFVQSSVNARSLSIKESPATKTLLTYPPKPNRGAITITTDDFVCLEEEQFLNDVIIDFYLKWLVTEKLTPEDRAKTHVFSTFFYKRLTAKPKKGRRSDPHECDPSLSAAQKRHARVKSWTKQIDIFQKDFIVIPINEHSHWFLAIICFPGLDPPAKMADSTPMDRVRKSKRPVKLEMPLIDGELSERDEASGDDDDLEDDEESESKVNESKNTDKPINDCKKQPCIVIFDSLTGASRSRIVATLREYLSVEYLRQKGVAKVFTKDCIKGACPAVPQQTNFSDCGLFTLEFAEQFFENPLTDFTVPIRTLRNWFPQSLVSRKREQVAALIKKLMDELKPGHQISLPKLRFNSDAQLPQRPPSPQVPPVNPEAPEKTVTLPTEKVNLPAQLTIPPPESPSDHQPAILRDPDTSEVLLIVNRRQQPEPTKESALPRPAEQEAPTQQPPIESAPKYQKVSSANSAGLVGTLSPHSLFADPRSRPIPSVTTVDLPTPKSKTPKGPISRNVIRTSNFNVPTTITQETLPVKITDMIPFVNNASQRPCVTSQIKSLTSQIKAFNSMGGVKAEEKAKLLNSNFRLISTSTNVAATGNSIKLATLTENAKVVPPPKESVPILSPPLTSVASTFAVRVPTMSKSSIEDQQLSLENALSPSPPRAFATPPHMKVRPDLNTPSPGSLNIGTPARVIETEKVSLAPSPSPHHTEKLTNITALSSTGLEPAKVVQAAPPSVFRFSARGTSSGRRVATPKRFLEEADSPVFTKRKGRARHQGS